MQIDHHIDTHTAFDLLDEILKRPKAKRVSKIDRPLVLYGAGDLGSMAMAYFQRIGVAVDYTVDLRADYLRTRGAWSGGKLLLPEEVSDRQKRENLLAVCIATIPYTPLSNQLKELGWHHIVPFYDLAEAYRDKHPLSNGWYADRLDAQDLDKIRSVLARWHDDVSRAHHLQFIAWRVLREDWLFSCAPVTIGDRFFIDGVLKELREPLRFADIGAYHGKVTMALMDRAALKLDEVWLVEPDRDSLSQLKSKLENLPEEERERCHILPYAVGARSHIDRFFEGLGYASQISSLGKREIPITTIDHLNMSPNYIKLHLEGNELAALKGAQVTLKKWKPVIAATSYHNQDGLWKLPDWIMSELPDYKVIMRLHSWSGTGSVVYAWPGN